MRCQKLKLTWEDLLNITQEVIQIYLHLEQVDSQSI